MFIFIITTLYDVSHNNIHRWYLSLKSDDKDYFITSYRFEMLMYSKKKDYWKHYEFLTTDNR